MARRSDHSRAEIKSMALKAADRILVEQGLRGLSTRKVAAAIGYTVGSLYLVFENLEDLLLQLNVRTLESLYQRLQQIVQGCDQPRHCLQQLAVEYIDFAQDNHSRWSAIFERQRQQHVPAWYQEKISSMFELIEQQFHRLLPEADAKSSADNARAYWCAVHGVCMLALTGRLGIASSRSAQHITDVLIGNFLDGLLSKDKNK